jgi:tetratricopeptide (TPR) repeat protein
MTLSEQEQRRETQRRNQRKNDVKPGTTSAMRGAKDFSIDPAATEYQWLQQASAEEQEVYRLTNRAMEALRMLDLDDAIAAFGAAVQIKPNAYVWQQGIAQFYKGDIDGAAATFTRCASTYEAKFDMPATEERIWRNACNLKKYYTMSWSDRKQVRDSNTMEQLVPAVPETDDTHRLMGSERRRVLRLVHDLFEATLKGNHVEEILARARIRSMAGLVGESNFGPELDQKLWKIQAWYFLALYHDVKGEDDESKSCLKIALNLRPNANASDIVHVLPLLHMHTRNWFDEEDISVPPHEAKFITIDEAVENSLRTSIQKMRHTDITDALRARSMLYTGSKNMVTERLLERLLPKVYDENLF